MAAVINNAADVLNVALVRIGYKLRVASLYDGSEAANKALDIYGQTRDDLLRDGNWDFARRDVPLTLLKQAPDGGYYVTPWDPAVNPPIGYQYEYALPEDYLKIRYVRTQPGFLLDMSPLPTLSSIVNDAAYTPTRRVLVCNIPSAIFTYTAQVTDPAQWPADYVEALAAALGRRLVPSLVSANMAQLAGHDEAVAAQLAGSNQG